MIWAFGFAFAASWELAGVYDPSAVAALRTEPREAWMWKPAAGMTASCGIAKAPDGLGITEAEALANGLTPSLAILLRRVDTTAPALDTENLRVSLGRGKGEVDLAPAVTPRRLRVRVGGTASSADQMLVRTQLAMELCMEHKLGRAWQGGGREALRDAFLLNLPGKDGPERMYFRGQGAPVAPLLGPPDACFVPTDTWDAGDRLPGAPPRLKLVPADVWGSALRDCGEGNDELSPSIPLQLGGVSTGGRAPEAPWHDLDVVVAGAGGATQLRVTLDGRTFVDGDPLLRELPPTDDGEVREGVFDILAHVPGTYPTVGPPEDPDRFTLLLVPNWQIVEAAGLLDLGGWEKGSPTDGVGWLLAHPEHLYVQVGDPKATELDNLASRFSTPLAGLFRWGYTTGIDAGRNEIVLVGEAPPDEAQTAAAQRSHEHVWTLGALGVTLVLSLAGVRRLTQLWTPVPEERVHYWPQSAEPPAAGPAPGNPIAGEAQS